MVPIHQSEKGRKWGLRIGPILYFLIVMFITVAGHLPHAPLLPSVLRPAPTRLARHFPLRPLPSLHRNPLCRHAAWSPQVNQDSTKQNGETFLPKISDVAYLKSTAEQPWRSWGRWSRGRKWSRQNTFPDENIAHPTFQSTSLVSVFDSESFLLYLILCHTQLISRCLALLNLGHWKRSLSMAITFVSLGYEIFSFAQKAFPDEEEVNKSNYVFQLRPGIYINYLMRYESWSPQPNKYCTSLSCGMNNEYWTWNTWAKW